MIQTASGLPRGRLNAAIALLMGLALMIFIQGCTIIGAGIGAIADQSNHTQARMPAERAEILKAGQEITLALGDSITLSGLFLIAIVKTDTLYHSPDSTSPGAPWISIHRRLQSITINAYGERVDIPGDQVTAIYLQEKKSGLRNGIVFGLICDALFYTFYWIGSIYAMKDMS
jgi:hypothetical protein